MFCLAVVNQAPAVVQMMTWSEADMLRYGVPPVSETSFARSVWRVIAWVCFVWVKQLVFILVARILLKTILLKFSNWFQMFHKTFRWGDVVGESCEIFQIFLGELPGRCRLFISNLQVELPLAADVPAESDTAGVTTAGVGIFYLHHRHCHIIWRFHRSFSHHVRMASSCDSWMVVVYIMLVQSGVPSADTLAVSMRFLSCFTKLRSGQADLMVPGWKHQALGSLGRGGFRTLT